MITERRHSLSKSKFNMIRPGCYSFLVQVKKLGKMQKPLCALAMSFFNVQNNEKLPSKIYIADSWLLCWHCLNLMISIYFLHLSPKVKHGCKIWTSLNLLSWPQTSSMIILISSHEMKKSHINLKLSLILHTTGWNIEYYYLYVTRPCKIWPRPGRNITAY